MKCPVDGETLVMADRSGVEIDYCPKCRGVWLDRSGTGTDVPDAPEGPDLHVPRIRGLASVLQFLPSVR